MVKVKDSAQLSDIIKKLNETKDIYNVYRE